MLRVVVSITCGRRDPGPRGDDGESWIWKLHRSGRLAKTKNQSMKKGSKGVTMQQKCNVTMSWKNKEWGNELKGQTWRRKLRRDQSQRKADLIMILKRRSQQGEGMRQNESEVEVVEIKQELRPVRVSRIGESEKNCWRRMYKKGKKGCNCHEKRVAYHQQIKRKRVPKYAVEIDGQRAQSHSEFNA